LLSGGYFLPYKNQSSGTKSNDNDVSIWKKIGHNAAAIIAPSADRQSNAIRHFLGINDADLPIPGSL
jgi:hypothetical protein